MPKLNKRKIAIVASSTNEMADVAYIIDERGGNSNNPVGKNKRKRQSKRNTKPKKHEYLCAWTDGEDPQWVDAKFLQDSAALEEWNDKEDEEPEVYDDPKVSEEKCNTLSSFLKNAKRPCFLLGAGISAPVLPTFRGKNGLWTKYAYKNEKADAKVSDGLQPTLAHRALFALEKAGYVYWIATQNYDDLSSRSGYPESKLSELHGNIFSETCSDCHETYHRDFEVPLDDSVDHETGRNCEKCNGVLRDNIIHFGEDLPWHDLKMANAKFVGSDLTIVLGSSLNVEPAASLPFRSKRRTTRSSAKETRPKACIVNLQPTPYDDESDLIIRNTCDKVMDTIAKNLLGESWENDCNVVKDAS